MDSSGVVISIGDTTLPTPTVFSVVESDGDAKSTNRSQDWVLRRDRIRSNIKAVSLKWTCTAEQATTIRNAVAAAGLSVTIQFLGSTSTHTMYAGDRSYEAVTLRGSERWTVSFTLTEY